MKLSIIIPVYNERGTVLTVVERVQQTPWEKEIIIVDDGSTDGTSETLRVLKRAPAVTVLHHEHNRGKGPPCGRA